MPPVSDVDQGGSSQYDIYFQQVPYYGFTSPELAGPEVWNDFSSHIVVHNTFSPGFPPNDDPEGLVLGALKVTIAHEFYHAIQFAYDVSEVSFFMEMSSTWMEEMAYPQVNDNYNYLPDFFNVTQVGLQAGDAHRYAVVHLAEVPSRALWCSNHAHNVGALPHDNRDHGLGKPQSTLREALSKRSSRAS